MLVSFNNKLANYYYKKKLNVNGKFRNTKKRKKEDVFQISSF